MSILDRYRAWKRARELAQERDAWQQYCANWWHEYHIQYQIAFTEVKIILDEDLCSSRHWTA